MPDSRMSRREVLTAATAVGLLSSTKATPVVAEGGFETIRHEVFLPGLSAEHDGLVVAHLTDIHLGPQTPMARIQAALAATEEADLLVLTGDFVTYTRGPLELFKSTFEKRPDIPTLACLGNHDHIVNAVDVRRELERTNICVLQNENTQVEIKGGPLQVIGVDDGTTHHDDVGKAFRGVRNDASRLVLTHSPPTADKLPADEGLLCLTGHTHGGAIMIGALTTTVSRLLGQPYVRGFYGVRGNQLYVNRGLGARLRLHSDPELTLFTLRSTDS